MYPQIISKLNRTVWAATPHTLESIRMVLQSKLRGETHATDGGDSLALPQLSAAAQAMFGGGDREASKKPYQVSGTTAIIPVFGVIGKHLSSLETFCGGLDVDALVHAASLAYEDSEISQAVLWFHSPGGTVTGLPEAARALADINAEMPLYAYTDGMCCSAAYWLASQCDSIFAAPSSDVGSIGVYLSWIDQTKHAEKEGFELKLYRAGEFKAMGHPLKDVTEAEAELLQTEVNVIWDFFKTAVTSQRPQVGESTMQGQTFSFGDQLTTGLVDAHYDSIGKLLSDIEGQG